MVSDFCIAAPTRPLPRLFSAVCASTPRSPNGYAHALFNDRAGRFRSVHSRGDGRAWHDNEASNVCRPSPRHSITPRLTFVKRGAGNQDHKKRAAHCCATVIILPPSRRSSRSACRRTCNMVGLGAVALHVRGNEIVHPVASASGARYHMVCGERQRMRRITAPIERFAAIIAGSSRTLGAFAQDGAVAMVKSRILAHQAITSLI